MESIQTNVKENAQEDRKFSLKIAERPFENVKL